MSYASALGSTLVKENPSTIITGAIGYRYNVVLTPVSTASAGTWISSGITLPQGVWSVLGTSRAQASAGNLTSVITGIYINGSVVQQFITPTSAVIDGPTVAGSVVSDGNDVLTFRIFATTSGGANWLAGGNNEDRRVYVVRVA